MSLFSTFYSGDATLIESMLRKGDFEFPKESNVKSVDFSGGVSQPCLIPEDFLVLTKGGKDSFWKLNEHNLIKSETQGLYRLGDSETERLLALSQIRLSQFSDQWNQQRAEERERIVRTASIWMSSAYWKITGGISLGLLISYVLNRSSFALLIILTAWIVCAITFGFYVAHRRKLRINSRPKHQVVDWVSRLGELQRFLRQAQKSGACVYCYWSL